GYVAPGFSRFPAIGTLQDGVREGYYVHTPLGLAITSTRIYVDVAANTLHTWGIAAPVARITESGGLSISAVHQRLISAADGSTTEDLEELFAPTTIADPQRVFPVRDGVLLLTDGSDRSPMRYFDGGPAPTQWLDVPGELLGS